MNDKPYWTRHWLIDELSQWPPDTTFSPKSELASLYLRRADCAVSDSSPEANTSSLAVCKSIANALEVIRSEAGLSAQDWDEQLDAIEIWLASSLSAK